MSATAQFRRDDNNQIRAFASGNRAEYQRLNRVLENRQYSRRQYMGLSNG